MLLDCKTAPSFTSSLKIGVFERPLSPFLFSLGHATSSSRHSLILRPHTKTRAKTPSFGLLAKEAAVLQSIYAIYRDLFFSHSFLCPIYIKVLHAFGRFVSKHLLFQFLPANKKKLSNIRIIADILPEDVQHTRL